MDVPKIRFGLPVGAQPCIDFTEAAEREQKEKKKLKEWEILKKRERAANVPQAKLLLLDC